MVGWSALAPGMVGESGPRDLSPGMDGWALGGLVMLAFWSALIVGVVLLVRSLTGVPAAQGQPPHRESPLDILKRRYAAGEIRQEEYDRMRQELERS
jgi:putative membrane protein